MATIRNRQEFIALIVGLARAQMTKGIREEVAIRYGIAVAIIVALGRTAPTLISGFRTLDQQRTLKENVERFPNASNARPVAERSWHTVGLAIDLDTRSPSLSLFSALWRAMRGRVGADFASSDPGHFDFPVVGVVPRSIYE